MNEDFIKNIEIGTTFLMKQGAFLTVKNAEKTNTMTIGWGSIGFEWRKPMFTVLVRKSRFTHDLLENSDEFTVSIPINDKMKKALTFCGTKSGRYIDKFKECNLALIPGREISTPIIEGCELQFVCKIIYKQNMDPAALDATIKNNCYPDNDFHTIYYGQIIAAYKL
jgi:flavin reductase (DIM6/NTAB) family NADH-FMN oxidoreductase RutF